MVGGTVLNVIQSEESKTLVVVDDGDMIQVDIETEADVEATDRVWWQGGQVYVTRGSAHESVFSDKPFRKIGYSYGFCHLPRTKPGHI